MAGDGAQTRSVCYVDDRWPASSRCAARRPPGPVNIGNPDELTVLRDRRGRATLTGSRPTIVFVDRPVDDPQVRRPDTTLASELLGWRPRSPSRRGCDRTVEWFAEQQLECA